MSHSKFAELAQYYSDLPLLADEASQRAFLLRMITVSDFSSPYSFDLYKDLLATDDASLLLQMTYMIKKKATPVQRCNIVNLIRLMVKDDQFMSKLICDNKRYAIRAIMLHYEVTDYGQPINLDDLMLDLVLAGFTYEFEFYGKVTGDFAPQDTLTKNDLIQEWLPENIRVQHEFDMADRLWDLTAVGAEYMASKRVCLHCLPLQNILIRAIIEGSKDDVRYFSALQPVDTICPLEVNKVVNLLNNGVYTVELVRNLERAGLIQGVNFFGYDRIFMSLFGRGKFQEAYMTARDGDFTHVDRLAFDAEMYSQRVVRDALGNMRSVHDIRIFEQMYAFIATSLLPQKMKLYALTYMLQFQRVREFLIENHAEFKGKIESWLDPSVFSEFSYNGTTIDFQKFFVETSRHKYKELSAIVVNGPMGVQYFQDTPQNRVKLLKTKLEMTCRLVPQSRTAPSSALAIASHRVGRPPRGFGGDRVVRPPNISPPGG